MSDKREDNAGLDAIIIIILDIIVSIFSGL